MSLPQIASSVISPNVTGKFGGKCPFCSKKKMINRHTDKEFKTCFDCRIKCPNWNTCHSTRGKTTTNTRYATCAKCKFGDKYTPPTKKTEIEVSDLSDSDSDIEFSSVVEVAKTD